MAEYKLEIEGVFIVALGSFNPAIFQPYWFAGNNLIPSEEAAASKVEIVHRNATIFSTEWFSLQVTEVNFTLESYDPTKLLPLRDLALNTFRILEHTPLTAVGLNKVQHFLAPSEEAWHEFGHMLAPKPPWNGILINPGTRLLIIEGIRKGCDATYLQIRVEPSPRLHPRHGVAVSVNQHYDLMILCAERRGDTPGQPQSSQSASSAEVPPPAARMKYFLDILETSWDDFLQYSGAVAPHLFSSMRAKKKRAT